MIFKTCINGIYVTKENIHEYLQEIEDKLNEFVYNAIKDPLVLYNTNRSYWCAGVLKSYNNYFIWEACKVIKEGCQDPVKCELCKEMNEKNINCEKCNAEYMEIELENLKIELDYNMLNELFHSEVFHESSFGRPDIFHNEKDKDKIKKSLMSKIFGKHEKKESMFDWIP